MDVPISFHWDKLYKQYPDCKVILGIRDFDEWYESNNYLIYTLTVKSWIIYYFGCLIDPIFKMIIFDYYGGYYKQGIPFLLDKKNKMKIKEIYYDNMIKKVKDIVPAENLLIFNVCDGWKPLCDFLKVEIPKNVVFPRVNQRKELDRRLSIVERTVLVKLSKLLFKISAICVVLGLLILSI